MKQKYIRKNECLQPTCPENTKTPDDAFHKDAAPRVQIVVIHYGDRLLTETCLRSFAQLTYPNFQVVVVNNGAVDYRLEFSTDGLPPISTIHNRANIGFSAACNQGILAAYANSADYAWILNNDTEVTPQSLNALVSAAEGNLNLGAVGSVLAESGTEIRGGTVSFLTGLASHITNKKYKSPDYLCGASLLIRMKTLNNVGLFDPAFFLYWEDTDLSFRIRETGWQLGIAEASRVLHRGSSSSIFQSTGYDFHITASSVRFFSRHCRFWFFPVAVSATGRMIRRAIVGKFVNARAVWRGLQEGLSRRACSVSSSIPRLETDL